MTQLVNLMIHCSVSGKKKVFKAWALTSDINNTTLQTTNQRSTPPKA